MAFINKFLLIVSIIFILIIALDFIGLSELLASNGIAMAEAVPINKYCEKVVSIKYNQYSQTVETV